MTAGAQKYELDWNLAQVLCRYGWYAEAVVNRAYSGDSLTDIRVQTGDGMGAMVTKCRDGSGGHERLDDAIGSLLKQQDVKFAVAVCYPDGLTRDSVEEARYVWRMKPRGGTMSGLMSGGVADLALAISVVSGTPREPGPVARSLADALVQHDRDTLVVDLPHFTATGDSHIDVRRCLQKYYYLPFIVASHDPDREQFSLDGRGPDVLVVCKLTAAIQSESSATKVVNLTVNPSDSEEAQDVASKILDCFAPGANAIHSWGTIREIGFVELDDGDWSASRLISTFLQERLLELTQGCIFPVTELGALARIGPMGGTVRKAFVTKRPSPEAREFISLWGQDNRQVQRIRPKAESSVWADPDAKKSLGASRHWVKRSRLLFPVQPYLPKARTMAVRLDEPTLGSMWTNCTISKPEDEQADYEKALCVYFNSTLAILSMLDSFKPMGRLFRLESTARDLHRLPVPDFVQCSGAPKALAASFDEIGECELSPLPESDTCAVRSAIDRAVCEALGTREELVHLIRWHLVSEPSVTGKRYLTEERQLSFLSLTPKV